MDALPPQGTHIHTNTALPRPTDVSLVIEVRRWEDFEEGSWRVGSGKQVRKCVKNHGEHSVKDHRYKTRQPPWPNW